MRSTKNKKKTIGLKEGKKKLSNPSTKPPTTPPPPTAEPDPLARKWPPVTQYKANQTQKVGTRIKRETDIIEQRTEARNAPSEKKWAQYEENNKDVDIKRSRDPRALFYRVVCVCVRALITR